MRTLIACLITFAMLWALSPAAEKNQPKDFMPKILEQVFFQDFETPLNWNGANPPIGWSIIDNGISDGIWDSYDWARYSAWGGNTARVSGASSNRYNNDWIISPAADFSSATACTLFFRHYYDDYATQTADSALVLLSVDNGVTWGDTVAVYAGSDFGGDTVPDSEYFDVSSFAAGQSAVKVAFQYLKRQPVLVGSWRIDDVMLRADGSSLMSQNFESSWGPNGDNPPSGWSINDVNVIKWDENDWHQGSFSGWGNIAYVFWSPVEQQNELLISPAMDFSDSAYNIILSLKQWYDDQTSPRDTAYILGSTDGGGSWPETLAVYQGMDHGSSTNAAYDTLDLVSWANNQDQAAIGFKYVGNNDGKWYLDSVRVEKINMLARDVSVVSITAPQDSNIEGYSWPVSAIVENIGLNPMSFQVVFEISDTNGTEVYADTQTVSNLASLEQRAVDFTQWLAGEGQTHYFSCYLEAVTDMNHSNDTLFSSAYTFSHTGISGPVEGWSYKDNISGGPEFYWVDISDLGTPITFADSDNGNSGMIDMNITFEYFGAVYSRIAVSTNGWLSFIDSTGTDGSPSTIPDTDGPAAMIALLWADLDLQGGNAYYYHDVSSGQFIVQYDSVEFSAAPGSNIGMEIIFDDVENSVKMQYLYMSGIIEPNVTIGIENSTEDAGLPFNSYGEYGQAAMPGLAITYTYLPPHDVRTISIIEPQIFILDGNTYDIAARVLNVGANTETFNVVAYDNFGYTNTQSVTGLASLDTALVTFPGWAISGACSTYALNVFTDLSGDMNSQNDTIRVTQEASQAANTQYIYDDGALFTGITTWDTSDVVASKLNAPFENYSISAVAFKFLNEDEDPLWEPDSVIAKIYVDNDNDGYPEDSPVYRKKLAVSKNGWTLWNLGCDTTITFNCSDFWVGWSITDSAGAAALGLDRTIDYQNNKWAREAGEWHVLSQFFGDYMIRAYINADSLSAPNVGLGTTQVIGAAPPDGADTSGTFIQNTGSGCDLRYKVKVLQTASGLGFASNRELGSLPQPLDNGGPDAYGYTWQDSDDPEGPNFLWIDISGIGTEVGWDHGNTDDGFTNPIPMGMTFNYYGVNYDNIVISTNGWISFNPCRDPFAFSANGMIPVQDELNAFMAIDWDNLDGGVSGHCYYYHDIAANSFIVSWVNWGHNPGAINPHDFQLILDGTGGSIQFAYHNGIFQSDVTIGIENEDGTDGLLIAYEEPYIHNDLSVLIKPPIFWLSTDLASGVLGPLSSELPFNIFMNALSLPVGIYNGAIAVISNDVDEPEAYIGVQFEVEGVCAYVPGDVNGSGNANGIDVTFMVNFFRGGSAPHDECPPCEILGTNMRYPQGDVNGTCVWNGIDVTYFVNYLKGIGPALRYCDQCPPVAGMSVWQEGIGEDSKRNAVSKILKLPSKIEGR